ncbi:hypothetical protein GW915_07405, partial [bacterium]|nr:hypothetical protein [bacterium]
MSSEDHYLLFGDGSWPAESVAKVLPEDAPVCVWIDGKGWVLPGRGKLKQNIDISKAASHKAAQNCLLENSPVAIIGFEDAEKAQKISDALKSKCSEIKILRVGTRGS